jgi:hypothetical protein
MLTGVVVVLLVLIALLAIPITLTFKISAQQASQNDIRLYWLFGLVRIRIPLPKPREYATKDEQQEKKSKREKIKSRKKPNVLAAIRLRKFRQRIFRFIRDLWHAIYKQDLILHMRLGLGDPADTGQLWAVIGPVTGMLSNVQAASITIEPEFMELAFELDGSGGIRIIPLQLIYLALALLLSPPVWRGFIQMRSAN